jgi:hypothetical protein
MILERSRESSGLPLVFLLKTLIPLFAALLALQGIAQAIRAWRVLFPPSSSGLAGRSSAALDAPPELVLGLADGKTRGRGMTTG